MDVPSRRGRHTNLFAGVPQIELLCDEFAARWGKPESSTIEQLLHRREECDRRPLLHELLLVELRLRRENGDVPACCHYRERFPDDVDIVEAVFLETSHDVPTWTGDLQRPADQSTCLMTAGERIRSAAFVPGARFGDYEIVSEIARGGMGVVFRARQVSLNRHVALKMILSAQLASPDEIVRFRVEAEAAARLEHPGIVPIYEIGEIDGQHFYSMALVTGGSLSTLLRNGPLEPQHAAGLMRTVAEAVQYAHSRNIIHRDLKPANVLLTDAGAPKVTDFGLAKNVADDSGLTATGQILGSPSYMAPEQASGRIREIGPLADVYALGAILYELLTGQPPFRGATVMETLQAVVSSEARSPREINPRVNADLATICLKCLEKDPARRYASASEVAVELGAFLEHRPISARPVSRWERSWRWCRRNPIAVGLLTAVGVTLIASIAGLYYRSALQSSRASEAAANSAALAAKSAEDSARRLARTQEYYAALNSARNTASERSPGWSWKCLEEVRRAAGLRPADADAADLVELRTLAAQSLAARDVRPWRNVAAGTDCAALEFSPDGTRLAIAEGKAGQVSVVRVVDLQADGAETVYSASNMMGNLARLAQGIGSYQDQLRSVAFSPDGRRLAAGSSYGMIHIWDASIEGATPVSWQVGDDGIGQLEFSRDGQTLYSLTWPSDRLEIWSLDGSHVGTIELEQQLSGFAFSDDGSRLAVTGERLDLYSGDGARLLLSTEEFVPDSIRWSHDGRWIAGRRSGELRLIDVTNGCQSPPLLDVDESDVASGEKLCFTPNDECVLDVEGDGTLRLWDIAAGRLVSRLPVNQANRRALDVSPRGDRVGVGTQSGVAIAELRVPQTVRCLGINPSPVLGADWLTRADSVVTSTVTYDRSVQEDALRQWSVSDGRLQRQLTVANAAAPQWEARRFEGEGGLAVHPVQDSVFASMRHAGLCEIASEDQAAARVRCLNVPALASAVELQESTWWAGDPESDPAASDGRAVRLTADDAASACRIDLKSLALPKSANWWHIVAAIRFEGVPRDGTAFVLQFDSADERYDSQISTRFLRETTDGYELYWLDHLNLSYCNEENGHYDLLLRVPADAPAGQSVWIDRVLLIPSSRDQSRDIRSEALGAISIDPTGARVWGIFNEELVVAWEYPSLKVQSAWSDAFAEVLYGDDVLYSLAAGQKWTAVGTRRGIVRLLEADSGRMHHQVEGPGGPIHALAFDATGELLAIGGELGGIRLIDATQSSRSHDLNGHSRRIETLSFNRDGTLFASGAMDGTVRLWQRDGDSFTPFLTFVQLGRPVRTVDFNSDGSLLLVVIEGECAVRVWDVQELDAQLMAVGIGR